MEAILLISGYMLIMTALAYVIFIGKKEKQIYESTMKLVIIESPYKAKGTATTEELVEYARACMKDAISRGEAPYASHLLLTQVLDDTNIDERKLGIEIGLKWGQKADKTVVYIDYGISPGMRQGINRAKEEGRMIEYRQIL